MRGDSGRARVAGCCPPLLPPLAPGCWTGSFDKSWTEEGGTTPISCHITPPLPSLLRESSPICGRWRLESGWGHFLQNCVGDLGPCHLRDFC